jgi:hypothetical protein
MKYRIKSRTHEEKGNVAGCAELLIFPGSSLDLCRFPQLRLIYHHLILLFLRAVRHEKYDHRHDDYLVQQPARRSESLCP